MNESFSAPHIAALSQSRTGIAALKAAYSKINGIDPASDTYKKLIAMLDGLDLKSLQSLAGAEVKFVSKLAQNRVARRSIKKEEVESIDELSTNKLADYKKKAGAAASAADKAGDTKTGNKRFSGIMKATRKQFANDAKSKTEELSPKQKALDKNKNGKIDGSDLAKLRGEELSPKQKEIDKNKNGKIDATDLAHLRSKKKLPQGADFAAQRRKERLASNGRMDEDIELDEAQVVDYKKVGDVTYKRIDKGIWKPIPKNHEIKKIGDTVHKRIDKGNWSPQQAHHKMAEAVEVGDKVSFNHPMTAAPGKTMKKVGTVHKVEDDTVHVKVKSKYGVMTHKKTASELTKEEFNIGEESINEKSDYEVYHKDYSGAVQAAIKQAEKRGFEVDMDDWHDKVATGPKKPSSGKTNSFSVNLMKDGKPSKKKLQMQVYNMDDHKYELNMYIEETEQGVAEAAKWRSNPGAYDVDDEGNKTPRNPNSPKFGYDPLQRRADTANDAKTPRGKTAALKTSLKMAKGNKGVAEGSDYTSPKLGTVKANLMNTQKPTVQVQVFKHNTLRGDSYWVTKEVKTFKTMDQAQAYADRINKKDVAEETLSELNKYTQFYQFLDKVYSYTKKSKKDQGDQFNKIGKGIRDKDPKSANKAGHKFSMRSIGQNRAEKQLAKEAASPAQQAAIAIAMKKDGKKPKMSEGIVDKIKAIKRGMQAKAKADDHFDKAGDPKNANASKDLKKAVRYHNLLNKEEVVLEARKKSFKDVKKKMKEEEKPNKSTVKKGDDLTGKREPIEINPEIKS